MSLSPTAPPPSEETVRVTLLLSGGHRHELILSMNDAMLMALFRIVGDRANGKDAVGLLQLPLADGDMAIAVPAREVIGLITEPALQVDGDFAPKVPVDTPPKLTEVPKAPMGGTSVVEAPALIIPKGNAGTPLVTQGARLSGLPENARVTLVQAQPDNPDILASSWVVAENFLTPKENRALYDYALRKKAQFKPTETSTGTANYRQSLILPSFPEFAPLFTERIGHLVPEVLRLMGMQPFPMGTIEAQLTAHNDGNFYKMHNDNGSADTASREFTYVYYFCREPKPFTGGELKIYDTRVRDGYYVNAETWNLFEPNNNNIVFFLARYLHEVMPVHVASRSFMDSRFTVNGWVHLKK